MFKRPEEPELESSAQASTSGVKRKNKSIAVVKKARKCKGYYLLEELLEKRNYMKNTKTAQDYNGIKYFTKIEYNNLLSYDREVDGGFEFFQRIKEDIFSELRQKLKIHGLVRVFVNFSISNQKETIDESGEKSMNSIKDLFYIGLRSVEIYNSPESLEDFYKDLLDRVSEKRDKDRGESGLHYIKTHSITFGITPCSLLGAYGYIELPKKIVNKKACVNIDPKDSSDNKCFLYAVWYGLEDLKLRDEEEKAVLLANDDGAKSRIRKQFEDKRKILKKV